MVSPSTSSSQRMSDEYDDVVSAYWNPMEEYDPLNALHEHILATHPDLDTSVLTDDELIALLKNAKETKELAYLNMNMSKQISPEGKSIISIDSPAYSMSQASSAFSQSSSLQQDS